MLAIKSPDPKIVPILYEIPPFSSPATNIVIYSPALPAKAKNVTPDNDCEILSCVEIS